MSEPAAARPVLALAVIALIAAAHGLIYALGLPLWQTPDEPMLYEYAALTAELGRVPTSRDHSPALDAALLAAMNREEFWRHALGATPNPPPATLDEALRLFPMPRQVGGDPPVYFVLAALPLHLAGNWGWSVDAQARTLRVLNALLLPLGALCAYALAREVGAPALAGLGAAALVALQPMYAFVGAGLSNDGPANLVAALLCLVIVRAVRRGLPGRDVVLTLALALLVVQTKRSALPVALAAGLLGAAWGVKACAALTPRSRTTLLALTTGAAALACGIALAGQLAWSRADAWYDTRSLAPAARASAADGYALALEPGQEVIQALPDVAAVYLRNGPLQLGARVWSDGPATVRLAVDTGTRTQERSFPLDGVADVRLDAVVNSSASAVRVRIFAEQGRLKVGTIWMRAPRRPGELLANGDLARPALRPDSPLIPLTRYLRLAELGWAAESGRVGWGLDVREWSRWAFDSFWGHFGWMRIAVVRDSFWEPAIAAVCAVGLAGAVLALARAGPAHRAPRAVLLALPACAMLLLLVNALADPYPVQQGRYLFPILPALAAAVATGWSALVPARFKPFWLLAWLGFWLSLVGAALFTLAATYTR